MAKGPSSKSATEDSASESDGIPPGHVAVGRVVAAWGRGGEVRIEPLAPAGVLSPGRRLTAGGFEHQVEHCRAAGRMLVAKLSGISYRDQARALQGAYLTVPQQDLPPLPEGEYYRYQLIGLAVRAADGRDLGHVVEVTSTPSNDVYLVRGPLGEILVPAVDDIVQGVDLTAGVVTVEIVPGLLR